MVEDLPEEISEEMEAELNEDIDAMEKLIEIAESGLEDGQSLNDLARHDREALVNDIVLPHLKLYESADGDFARDTIKDAIGELRDQFKEDGPEEAAETVEKAIASWDEQIANELNISINI